MFIASSKICPNLPPNSSIGRRDKSWFGSLFHECISNIFSNSTFYIQAFDPSTPKAFSAIGCIVWKCFLPPAHSQEFSLVCAYFIKSIQDNLEKHPWTELLHNQDIVVRIFAIKVSLNMIQTGGDDDGKANQFNKNALLESILGNLYCLNP